MEKASLAEELGHIKNHIKYPANKAQVVAACNQMSDLHPGNAEWVSKNLPDGTYRAPGDVLNALLTKV
jgi:hypothetical protein